MTEVQGRDSPPFKDRIIEASPEAPSFTLPCPTCGRTFVQASLERHIKVCETVLCKKRNVYQSDQKRTRELPTPLTPLVNKKPVKPPEEFLICKHCNRKFGYKAFERHEAWCEEKSKRLMVSPNKDMVALAKLQMRTAYRPKTPCEVRNSFHFRKEEDVPKICRKTSNISSLYNSEHVKESEDTQFIRSATGRGSIKKGPAQTKASQLRQIKNDAVVAKNEPEFIYAKSRSLTPGMSRSYTETPPLRQGSFLRRSASTRGRNSQVPDQLVRPNVLRPKRSEPEGIEMNGDYDHMLEYDPYQLAANQMNELLFGGGGSHPLKPSSNSAFQKYVPNAKAYSNYDASASTFKSHSPPEGKVARFCHECGHPFELPSIRFCCECGVKRLYC